MFCKYCGKEMKGTAAFCSACGNASVARQDSYASYEATVPKQKPNGYAIASLVLAFGGISCFMPVIGGVLAIVLGRVSMKIALRKHEPTNMAIVGIALGVVSFIVNFVVFWIISGS